ncbi:hypothetical protein PMNALOAF_4100 [Methylobacterium adhaesivum]|uniref:Helix-turn-helix domain-containing protein n=1 Tax=Methylobacterium adhaesivum TaxID=333297 RepID=A0ABT8BMM3_9HYPH|nr:hypothetical protein [Methylobacterium adhaesivum]MDN3592478.1 hypothetical protein [Methylobacterium adhaesivum]GJD32821.1 hypothetical protein PMNALOAF_4100 [Methylobacterium adhaesivum]
MTKTNNIDTSPELLVSLPKAAKMLDLSARSIRRHFDLVKIGGAVRVRVADIQKKIDSTGQQSNAA